jgi:hypothetical protein
MPASLASREPAARRSHPGREARRLFNKLQTTAILDLQQGRKLNPRKRCECGACATCEDNARWERIFNEKFADPSYYTLRPVSHGSPIAEL